MIRGEIMMAPWVQIMLRTLIAVITLFLLTKILGKRQITQLSVFEYITGITIGSVAADVTLDIKDDWYLGLISLVVWVAVSFGIEYLQMKSKKMRDWIDGKSTVLIRNGKILERNLKKEKLTSDELLALLRSKNAFKVSDVEFAVIEPTGQLSVLLKCENQPLTPKHLGITVAQESEPQALIMDGQLLEQTLNKIGHNKKWLQEQLRKLGITSMQDVYLAQVDSNGQLYVDLFNDQITLANPQKQAATLATLKKCAADLELLSFITKDKKTKQMYSQCQCTLQNVITNIKPLLSDENK